MIVFGQAHLITRKGIATDNTKLHLILTIANYTFDLGVTGGLAKPSFINAAACEKNRGSVHRAVNETAGELRYRIKTTTIKACATAGGITH